MTVIIIFISSLTTIIVIVARMTVITWLEQDAPKEAKKWKMQDNWGLGRCEGSFGKLRVLWEM